MFKKFKTRLIFLIISMTVTVSLILIAMTYGVIYTKVVSLSQDYSNQFIRQLCDNVEFYLKGIEADTYSLSYTSELRSYGSHFVTHDLSPSKDAMKKILWDVYKQQPDIDDVNLILDDRTLLTLFNMYGESSLVDLSNYYQKDEILSQARFIPLLHYNRNGQPALSCIKAISGAANEKGKYYAMISITVKDIFNILKQVDLGAGSGACLVDANGAVQYSTTTDPDFSADMNRLIKKENFTETNSFIARLNRKKYLLSVTSIGNSSLCAVVYTPLANITDSATSFLTTAILIMLFFLALLTFFSIRLANRLIFPITNLTSRIQDMNQNLTVIPPVPGTEETDLLYETLNHLTENVKTLMAEKAQQSRAKRKAELQALQAQINPHFLYNTLDSINALAILNDEKDISHMITSLGHLLRLSISQPEEFVTIEDEIKHVKAYLEIQQIRYEDKFQVAFDVDSGLLYHHVVRLILQPLVENSISHGFELKEGTGHIRVIVRRAGEQLLMQIADDGIGVSADKAAEINANLQALKKPGTASGSSIGIYNVNERLYLYYGSSASMRFESTEGAGTVVTIAIPFEEDLGHVESYHC